jgi:hypothetical protein
VIADTLDVEILLAAEQDGEIECTGHVHGFGLPTSGIQAKWEFEERPVPILRYRVSTTGWFTDIDGVARIRLPRRGLRKVIVRVTRGDIAVIDESGGGTGPDRLPALDLHTSDGRVHRPAGTSPRKSSADSYRSFGRLQPRKIAAVRRRIHPFYHFGNCLKMKKRRHLPID